MFAPIDILLIYVALLFTQFTTHIPLSQLWDSPLAFPLCAASYIIFLFLLKVYFIRIVDSSLELVVRGFLALFFSSLVNVIFLLIETKDFSLVFRHQIPFVSYVILLVLGYRVAYRIALSYHPVSPTALQKPKALIYGAGEIGMQLVRQQYKNKLSLAILGFIDDNPIKQSAMINGVKVLGSLEQLPEILRSIDIQVLVIAITNLSSERMKVALEVAERFGVEVKIIPSLFEMESHKKGVADLRSINIEDMIGRRQVSLDREPIKQMVEGKRVLVTGAGGSIGSEICRQLLEYNPKALMLVDIDETELHDLSLRLHDYKEEFSEKIIPIVCDVRDRAKVNKIFTTHSPELVFHAAAYKHVPMMEYYPEEAARTNIVGTYNVFEAAVSHGVYRCILISTDKAVNPTNVMGATKRVAEQIARMLSNDTTEIVCVRFGNVLGSRGSMLPLFLEQMNQGLPITVTDKNIIRYFMTIPEAVSLVFQAGSLAKGGEVMVLEMGDPVNIYDFAQKLVKYFGDGKSKVVITGLRPGEKLYEEKLSDHDKTIPTDNPKVYRAKVNGTMDRANFQQFYDEIPQLSPDQVIERIKEFVPEFTRNGKMIIGH
jgi:FlaA1/EpsC-like NDP-sugar epimerase